jgi:hypothetical protein
MLPGFRFLFGALILSVSVLVFGVGAAALLRTAHEEFATAPAWRPAPETRFAQSNETNPPPVLAMLRVDDPPKEAVKGKPEDTLKPADVTVEAPKLEPVASNDAPATVAADPAPAPQPGLDNTAALQPADAPQAELAKPETPASESPAPAEAAAATADAAAEPAKLATTEPPPAAPPATPAPVAAEAAPAGEAIPAPAAETAPATPEQARLPDPGPASTKIATLGGPPVLIQTTPRKETSAKPDRSAIKKRQQARRAAQRRRAALRAARLAAQQQAANPFATPVSR